MFVFYVGGGQRVTFRSWRSPSTGWVLGIKLSSSGLAVDTSTHGAISMALLSH